MRSFLWWVLFASTMIGCGGDDVPSALPTHRETGSRVPQRGKQVSPPLALQAPPADAVKTPSGLMFKRLNARSGTPLEPGQHALVRYTGWRQGTGETFFASRGPVEIDPASAAPVFREILPMLTKGDRVMLWAPAGAGMPESVVYDIELADVIAPRPVVLAPGVH